MRRRAYGVGILSLLSFALEAEPASACTLEPIRLHEIDAASSRSDTHAPAPPVVVAAEVSRRSGLTCGRDRCIENSCGDMGAIRIEIAPGADDQTPAERLGYRLEILEGLLPESVESRLGETLAARTPLLLSGLPFDDVGVLDVTVRAIAVDAAGNESAPSAPFVLAFDGCTLAAVGDLCEDELEPDDLPISAAGDISAGVLSAGDVAGRGLGVERSESSVLDGPAASCALPLGGSDTSALPALGWTLLGALALRRRR